MLNAIKTAMVTIIISFISGVLLDYYRNYAPRIVCNIGKGKVLRKNDKKVKVYSITIRNISKKTIHDLNISIAAQCEKLKLNSTKITNGLRFDILDQNNMYNIRIPFLTNNDSFLTKVIIENPDEVEGRPMIDLKSPENFKRINSHNNKNNSENKAVKNINDLLEKIFYNNRKIILGCVSVLMIVFMGIVAGEYYGSMGNNKNKVYKKAGVESNITNKSSETNEVETNYGANVETPMESNSTYNESEAIDSSDSYSNYLNGNTSEEVYPFTEGENYDTSQYKISESAEEENNNSVNNPYTSSSEETVNNNATEDTTKNDTTTDTSTAENKEESNKKKNDEDVDTTTGSDTSEDTSGGTTEGSTGDSTAPSN